MSYSDKRLIEVEAERDALAAALSEAKHAAATASIALGTSQARADALGRSRDVAHGEIDRLVAALGRAEAERDAARRHLAREERNNVALANDLVASEERAERLAAALDGMIALLPVCVMCEADAARRALYSCGSGTPTLCDECRIEHVQEKYRHIYTEHASAPTVRAARSALASPATTPSTGTETSK